MSRSEQQTPRLTRTSRLISLSSFALAVGAVLAMPAHAFAQSNKWEVDVAPLMSGTLRLDELPRALDLIGRGEGIKYALLP